METQKKTFIAELIENRLIVWDPEEGSELYRMGFYGKPVGIPKPKIAKFNTPLNIDLIEGMYLLENGFISIFQNSKGLEAEEFRKHACSVYEGFELKYLVYKDLRNRGYIVLPGIKFGCEYAIYEHGPGIDHAPYMVSVRSAADFLTSTDIVRAGRLATSVRKRFIIAIPNPKTSEVRYLMFKWFRA